MDTNHSSEVTPTAIVKKPYEKPAFRWEPVFVTTALSCGKISPTQLSCSGGNASAS